VSTRCGSGLSPSFHGPSGDEAEIGGGDIGSKALHISKRPPPPGSGAGSLRGRSLLDPAQAPSGVAPSRVRRRLPPGPLPPGSGAGSLRGRSLLDPAQAPSRIRRRLPPGSLPSGFGLRTALPARCPPKSPSCTGGSDAWPIGCLWDPEPAQRLPSPTFQGEFGSYLTPDRDSDPRHGPSCPFGGPGFRPSPTTHGSMGPPQGLTRPFSSRGGALGSRGGTRGSRGGTNCLEAYAQQEDRTEGGAGIRGRLAGGGGAPRVGRGSQLHTGRPLGRWLLTLIP
jgi:hypothetical protein